MGCVYSKHRRGDSTSPPEWYCKHPEWDGDDCEDCAVYVDEDVSRSEYEDFECHRRMEDKIIAEAEKRIERELERIDRG